MHSSCAIQNIQLQDWLNATFHLIYKGHSVTWTCVITRSITRRDIVIKSKRPPVTQSEVRLKRFSHRHLTSAFVDTIVVITPTVLHPRDPRNIALYYFGILAVDEGESRALIPLPPWHTNGHEPVSFIVIPSGHLLCSPSLHVAAFLCRWNCVLATIQSQAQKCR